MIRLVDCEVYAVEKMDITRSKLFTFFLNGHRQDFVVVYSGGEYEGVISYKKLLRTVSENVDDLLDKRKYICKPDDFNLFTNLKEIFKSAPNLLITLMNESGQILYFAFNEDTEEYYEIESVMQDLENDTSGDMLFAGDIFEHAEKVKIENLNEYAFRFYNILKRRKVPVEVYGEAWTVLFPGLCEIQQNVPENNILKIYADGVSRIGLGTAQNIHNQWKFIEEIGWIMHHEITERYRKKFKEKGVMCLTAYFPNRPSSYNTVEELYREKIGIQPARHGWDGPQFQEQIERVYGGKIDEKKWKTLKDEMNKDSRYMYDLENKICFGTAKNKVYLVGPCIVTGSMVVSLDESLGGCLNSEIRKLSDEYVVEGRPCALSAVREYENILQSLTLTENDIIILIDAWNFWDKGSCTRDILIDDILSQRKCDWFYDFPLHTNCIGNREISKAICRDYLTQIIQKPKENPRYLQAGKLQLNKSAERILNEYIESIRKVNAKEGMKIGSIVMNCNPMTNGHLYLIDTTRKMVDLLYIFIVEEDKSDFSFHERLALVRNETAYMENVAVVPSGKYVLSYITMPLYFQKQEKKQAVLDASNDLKIFGNYIAPGLGINVRFVGEEPIDLVTKQYNETMKIMLPMYGISVTEIPRLQQDGKPISASLVRQYLDEGKTNQIKNIVPQGVYSYLCQKRNTYEKKQ